MTQKSVGNENFIFTSGMIFKLEGWLSIPERRGKKKIDWKRQYVVVSARKILFYKSDAEKSAAPSMTLDIRLVLISSRMMAIKHNFSLWVLFSCWRHSSLRPINYNRSWSCSLSYVVGRMTRNDQAFSNTEYSTLVRSLVYLPTLYNTSHLFV